MLLGHNSNLQNKLNKHKTEENAYYHHGQKIVHGECESREASIKNVRKTKRWLFKHSVCFSGSPSCPVPLIVSAAVNAGQNSVHERERSGRF